MKSFWIAAGAVLLGVVGYLLFNDIVWAIPFALMGAILGWTFTRTSPSTDRDHVD